MAAPKKCSECGAELRLRPHRCPLCGAEVPQPKTETPAETNVERYQEGMRDLQKQLKKLRDEAEAV
jgi:predicted amidophosphoribosyltransferase